MAICPLDYRHSRRVRHSKVRSICAGQQEYLQQLAVEADVRRETCRREHPGQVQGKNPDNGEKLFVERRISHARDVGKLLRTDSGALPNCRARSKPGDIATKRDTGETQRLQGCVQNAW